MTSVISDGHPFGQMNVFRLDVPAPLTPGERDINLHWTALFSGSEMPVFALLDGSLIDDLPDLLATEGLPHQSLYQGRALAEIGAAGPWLVALRPDARLLRNLLTKSETGWHYWGKRTGIFLQTTLTLQELRAHLRRFTRIQDNNGKAFLFRFWDPLHARMYLQSLAHEPDQMTRWFRAGTTQTPVRFIVPEPDGSCWAVEMANTSGSATDAPIRLTQQQRQQMRKPLVEQDIKSTTGFLSSHAFFRSTPRDALEHQVRRAFARRGRMGVASPNGLAWLLLLTHLEDRIPKIGGLLDKIEGRQGFTFDQIARMLQRRGDMAQRDKG